LIDLTIDSDDFVKAWTKFRESTSSSPSGRHYGHYKAAALAYKAPKKLADRTDNPLHFPALAEYHATMSTLPLQYGFSPKRWRVSINAMLEKSNRSRLVDKLRIIHL